MEVGETILALHLIHAELNLAEGMVLVILQISKRDLEDSPLQCIIGVLQTSSPIDECLSNT